jgi:hypothetical protein
MRRAWRGGPFYQCFRLGYSTDPIHCRRWLHTQTSSYDYRKSAAKRHSDNVIVIWNDADVAASYLQHWRSCYEQGSDYQSTYSGFPMSLGDSRSDRTNPESHYC